MIHQRYSGSFVFVIYIWGQAWVTTCVIATIGIVWATSCFIGYWIKQNQIHLVISTPYIPIHCFPTCCDSQGCLTYCRCCGPLPPWIWPIGSHGSEGERPKADWWATHEKCTEFQGTLGFLFQLADRKGWIEQSSPWSSRCSTFLT